MSRLSLTECAGTPGPDYPSGLGESQHMGRLSPDFVMRNTDVSAQQAMGLSRFDSTRGGLREPERQMLRKANEILGFS